MAQRPDDLPDPAGLVAQPMPVLLELRHRLRIVGPIGGIEGILEVLGRVPAMPNSA